MIFSRCRKGPTTPTWFLAEACQKDIQKAIASNLFTKDELDQNYGKGRWLAMERYEISQGTSDSRAIGGGAKFGRASEAVFTGTDSLVGTGGEHAMRQRMYADVKLFRLSHRLRQALIYFSKVFTRMPECVLTTRPLRLPPVNVASDGQLGSEQVPSIGVLLADPMANTRIALLSSLSASFQSAWREEAAQHLWPRLNWQPPPQAWPCCSTAMFFGSLTTAPPLSQSRAVHNN